MCAEEIMGERDAASYSIVESDWCVSERLR